MKTRIGELYLHVNSGGFYTLFGFCKIEATNEDGVIYKSVDGGTNWVRPYSEFVDGRFIHISHDVLKSLRHALKNASSNG